ncbi:hypothetical protein AMAG_07929 [Allomyces macrogynus ATCC 38327]|uniref:Uncharacterized protein n=1 Tax=Allomyces macrogynus (strain ATCC 38327) TaxID=578462 RepID=A0A0L0SJT3_ALLM3|nr:hypothetical protein AMAG_07929 [Allomyces macrogynus ATCC 38327]|eukprot:KNE62743.1 hypothetical protein AMAG_07929 [Allomyces macrogynus ATCC 38327]
MRRDGMVVEDGWPRCGGWCDGTSNRSSWHGATGANAPRQTKTRPAAARTRPSFVVVDRIRHRERSGCRQEITTSIHPSTVNIDGHHGTWSRTTKLPTNRAPTPRNTMPRASRVDLSKRPAGANKPGTPATPAPAPAAPPAPQSWLRAFLVGLGHGIGNALGTFIGRALGAAFTAGGSYLLYRTNAGYKFACLIWPETKVDRFVEKTRTTTKLVLGTVIVLGTGATSFATYRKIQARRQIQDEPKRAAADGTPAVVQLEEKAE